MDAVPKPMRMQNEQWTWFDEGTDPWVEIGDTIGLIGYGEGSGEHYVTSPVYFWAYFPDGESPYTGAQEWDLGSGPKLSEWFEANELAEGGGGWCAQLNGTQLGCGGGFPTYANKIESGLEVDPNGKSASEVDNGNSATSEIYKEELGGEVKAPSVIEFYDETGSREWCYQRDVGGHSNWLDYGTGRPPCSDALLTASPIDASAALIPNAPAPDEDYVVPHGVTLSTAALDVEAREFATAQAGDGLPSSIEVSPATTLRTAASVVDPEFTAPAATGNGVSSWFGSEVNVVVLHGNFTWATAPMRSGTSGYPTGKVIDLVVDSHTGAIDSIRIENQSPKDMGTLGAATTSQPESD